MDIKDLVRDEFIENVGKIINIYKNKNVYKVYCNDGLQFQFSKKWIQDYQRCLSEESKKMGMSIAYIYSNGLYSELLKRTIGYDICDALKIDCISICIQDNKEHEFYSVEIQTDFKDSEFIMCASSFYEKYIINKVIIETEKETGSRRKRL